MSAIKPDAKETILHNNKCPDSPSECNLVIDDEFDASKGKLKRAKGVKGSEEPLAMLCTWDDCMQTFHDYPYFLQHLEEHVEAKETINDLYICGMEGCEYFTKSYDALFRHAHYHGYHERLKSIGTNHIERNALPMCSSVDQLDIEEIRPFICKWINCSLTCNAFQDFINHVNSHTKNMTRNCSKGEFNKCEWLGCSLKFSSIYKIRDHLRSHTTEKVIACPICGNTFASKTRFTDHRKRQLPAEFHSFQCSECSKLFSTERLLRDHMRSHINHYKCSFCDMTTSRPSMLGRHIRYRHMSERPFECNFCDFAAVTKANLDSHLKIHIAESLYACEFCDARYRWQVSLNKHLQTVHFPEGSRWYACHCCPQQFIRATLLTEHLKNMHDFNWPSGHSRFRYKKDADSLFRLQTVRYESIETAQDTVVDKIVDGQYDVRLSAGRDTKGMASFVVNIIKKPEKNRVQMKKNIKS